MQAFWLVSHDLEMGAICSLSPGILHTWPRIASAPDPREICRRLLKPHYLKPSLLNKIGRRSGANALIDRQMTTIRDRVSFMHAFHSTIFNFTYC